MADKILKKDSHKECRIADNSNIPPPNSNNCDEVNKVNKPSPITQGRIRKVLFESPQLHIFPCEEFWKKYHISSVIGEGGNATVFSGYKIEDSQTVVVKVSRYFKMLSNGIPEEVYYHENAAQNNAGVVQVLEWFSDANKLAIVMEHFPSCKEMFAFIATHRRGLPEEMAWKIFKQIVTTVGKCHENGLVHGDLKHENILINPETLQVKLIDFGSSLPSKHGHVTEMWTSFPPPELLLNGKCIGENSDIWSLGMVLVQMLCHYNPYYEEGFTTIANMLLGKRLKMISHSCKHLIYRLLCVDESSRIDIDEILGHEWIVNGLTTTFK